MQNYTDNQNEIIHIKNKLQELETFQPETKIPISKITIPKYFWFFSRKLKETYEELVLPKKPSEQSRFTPEDKKILTKLIGIDKLLNLSGEWPSDKKYLAFSSFIDSLVIYLEIIQNNTSKKFIQLTEDLLTKIKTKNNIFGFHKHSTKNITNTLSVSDLSPEHTSIYKKIIGLNQKTEPNQIENIITDEDSGLISEILNSPNETFGKSLYLTIDKERVFPFRIENNAPIKIVLKETNGKQEFVIAMADELIYESQEPEMDIVINHNFGTRNINVQIFNIVPGEVDLKHRTYPNIVYPSDNQVRIYLASPQRVHVIIGK